ncbi:MAG TPA: DUF2652 domain-containing protein [Solirubrobacterales bacterium]
MAVTEGPLVVADIAGYTTYLRGVELDHSRDVLADLLGIVAEQLSGVLDVAKIEGDAVFCAGGAGGDGAGLLGAIESCYSAFAARRRTIDFATSCECEACRRIPELDLKFVAHHGSFATHDVAGREELVGADVILVHRLLKNSVTEETGWPAYALLTDRFVAAAGIEPGPDATRHEESYDDAGEVGGVVIDLGRRWREEQERTSVRADPGRLAFELAAEVPASPAEAWLIQTDPGEQARWRVGLDRFDADDPGGARGVGSVNHCVHGKEVHEQEVVDWKPHSYFTYRERNPAGPCLWTVSFEPAGAGTRIRWEIELRGGLGQRALMLVARRRMRAVVRENFESLVDRAGGDPSAIEARG